MQWNHYATNLIVNITISIWADRCIISKVKFKDSEHELLLHTCLSLLEVIKQDTSQILSRDQESLIVKKKHMEKYEIGMLENWLKSIKVSKERKLLQTYH